MLDSSKRVALRRRLLRWYRTNARDLPWRRSDDPYRIWVSEIMLQQTRVEAAREHYERFVARFPTVAELAGASEDDVLSCWSGLGYYGRARNLHRAAGAVVGEHGGKLPSDEQALRRLPGIGPYTAGAVLSIAFDKPVPAVDGNVQRVLSRVFGVEGDPAREPAVGVLRELAAALVRGRHPGTWNQALMELGALVCTPSSPLCAACPWSGGLCVAEAEGRQEELPTRPARTELVRERLSMVAVLREEDVYLARPADGALVHGMWELPWVARANGRDELAKLRTSLRAHHGLEVSGLERRGEIRHAILNRRLEVDVWRGESKSRSGDSGTWAPRDDLSGHPVSALVRKALAHV